MKILDYLIIISLFLGDSFLAIIGWKNFENYSQITAIIPSFYLLLISVICSKSYNSKEYRWHILFIILVFVLYKIVWGKWTHAMLFGNLLIPIFTILWIQDVMKRGNTRGCFNLFIFLMIIEIGLAYFERFTSHLFFPYSLFNPDDINGYADSTFFRSNALLGHPLTNAVAVSLFFSFFIISDIRNKWIWAICLFGSILCFNARAAIIFTIFFFFLYYACQYKISIRSAFMLCIMVICAYYGIIEYGLADRLLEMEISEDDSSTMSRLIIFDVFYHLDWNILFRGINDQLDFIETQLGLAHIENSFIHFTLSLGLLMAIYAYYLIIVILIKSTTHLNLLARLYVICNFFVIINSNNILSCQKTSVALFIVCSYLFFYRRKENLVPDQTELFIS